MESSDSRSRAGCGTSTSDRALTGAVGAAAGGLADEDDFNLGDPIWR